MENQRAKITNFVDEHLPKHKHYWQDDYHDDQLVRQFDKTVDQNRMEQQLKWESLLKELSNYGYSVYDATYPIDRGYTVRIKPSNDSPHYLTLGVSLVLPYYCLFACSDYTQIATQIPTLVESSIIDLVQAYFPYERLADFLLGDSIEHYSIDGIDPFKDPTIFQVLFTSQGYSLLNI